MSPASATSAASRARRAPVSAREPGAEALAAQARDPSLPWLTRTRAALRLEAELLALADGDVRGQRRWLAIAGVTDCDAGELRARMRRTHARRDPEHLARQPCRITVGRYLWPPEEVVRLVDAQVRSTRGLPPALDPPHEDSEEEVEHLLAALPAYEREIVQRLTRRLVIRWVDDATPSGINGLVEYPVGTVVLVVKPPGSTLEIEIKRAGVRGPRPLDVRLRREDGTLVPPWHHLHGGSMLQILTPEWAQSAFFSRLFRLVHGRDAAMSRTIQIASIGAIPTPEGALHPLDYFATPEIQRDLDIASNIISETKEPLSPTPLTAAIRFLGVARPAQAIQIGNSSFRLDKLAEYLGARGPQAYFTQPFSETDARRFADDLLDEIIPGYEPPDGPYREHRRYVAAAFRANRGRADAAYVEALRQLGTFWGTLLGAGGYTSGESFVSRNVGLRQVWEDGAWHLRVAIMDHDALNVAGGGVERFRAREVLGHSRGDCRFLLARRTGPLHHRGSVVTLSAIYRTSPTLRRAGLTALRTSAKEAFDATRHALRTNPALRARFEESYLTELERWHQRMEQRDLPKALAKHAPFVRQIGFLYEGMGDG